MPKRQSFDTFAELETQLTTLETASSTSEIAPPQTLLLEDIITAGYQPRHYFDPSKLQELSHSIRQHGLLEPLLVRPHPHLAGKYELVAGERRYRACKLAELAEAPVTIRKFSDEQSMVLALVENLQREDLNPIEETDAILQLLAMRVGLAQPEVISHLYRMRNSIRQGKVRQNVLANRESIIIQETFDWIGKIGWESFIITRLPLLNLPDEVLGALRDGRIDQSKAKALSKVKDADIRARLLNTAAESNISLAKLRLQIKQLSEQSLSETEEISRPDSIRRRTHQLMPLVKRFNGWEDSEKLKRIESLLAELEELFGQADR